MVSEAYYFLLYVNKGKEKYLNWYFSKDKYISERSRENYPYRIKKHQSLLIRQLGNSDIQLQYNKIKNLKLAVQNIDGVIIRPGEIFSFWKLVGFPTKKKGYVDGILLSRGEVVEV